MEGTPVTNFGVVVPGCLYRSGQPGTVGYRWLKQQGIRSIVCLRAEHDNGAERMRDLGFRYLHLPIRDQYAPTEAQGRVFLDFVRKPENWPVLVHCEAGMGRAGTMVALARHAIDGWTMSEALREARRFRTLGLRMFGDQRRWLNRWAEQSAPGQWRTSLTPPVR